ncbi:hypothetical protein DSO57_1008195 [Entomophthora muscae]|uniref:Uncharacterized protein n=1 Tax=Entomophthora muscae TaxID=34485 RepID=A0ACC2U5N0_9FUNG|nr:hypothetical protein DSO57_1008195 [Entomophthora muscae]
MLNQDVDLPYFIWTEVLSYFDGWRLLELRLVCKLWNTSIKPVSGRNLKYNIIEGSRSKRDRFIENYGMHALSLEIKSLRSETKSLLDPASIQHSTLQLL